MPDPIFPPRSMPRLLLSLIGVLTLASRATAEPVDYLRDVKPTLQTHCFACHGALKQESGLRLDTASLARQGGDSGPAIEPGKAGDSLLIQRVAAKDEADRMPPEGKPLTKRQIEILRAWIDQGAKAPPGEKPEEDPRKHWAFQVPKRPAVPRVRNAAWVRNPIDAFVAAEHQKRVLTPMPQAEKHILLRRMYLDLIGLPPTRKELHAFLADKRANAYERVVRDLLSRPQHGERWARHWMDVWRYSDWYGRRQVNDVRNSYPHIWRWRDWIIHSLNADKGYDRMILEMLAADEIDPENDEAMPALGFIVRNWFSLNYDQWMKDQVEHTGKAFLGIRLNCAHCHDHKYDPISQREYFAFRAFFEPLELRHDRVPGGGHVDKYKKYVPGSGASLRPIQAGLARVFDVNVDAKTHMYRLGDARDRFPNRPPVPAAAPAFLGGEKLKVETVNLPPRAWYPGLKDWVQKEELAKREKAVGDAKEGLAQAKKVGKQPAIRGAEAKLAFAEADLRSTQLRIAADHARHLGGRGEPKELSSKASKAERLAQLCYAKYQLAKVEAALADAQAKAKGNANLQPNVIAAETQVAAAKKVVVAKEKNAAAKNATYTAFSPTYPKQSSGRRRALAQWIASEKNPLTARVAVNHVWLRHFGRPLVESVFDFGRSGKKPSHPKLLDWLAVELMESGWSMKHLHRLIVTSNTYRLQSKAANVSAANLETDSDNRYLWRYNRRRVEAEVVRDSILYTAGQLDPKLGGPEIDPKQEATSRRRSLYFSVYPEAGGMMQFLTMFDAPDTCDCYRRTTSIVPQQALAMANSQLMRNASRALGREGAGESGRQGEGRREDESLVTMMFETILTRKPSAEELAMCVKFLAKQRQLRKSNAAVRAKESLVRVLLNHNDFVTIP